MPNQYKALQKAQDIRDDPAHFGQVWHQTTTMARTSTTVLTFRAEGDKGEIGQYIFKDGSPDRITLTTFDRNGGSELMSQLDEWLNGASE